MNQKFPGRLNTWMTDLTKKKIVARKYERGILSGNTPAIYFLASHSNKLPIGYTGTEKKFLTRVYNEKYRSQRFIERSLYVAKLYLWLKEQAEKQKEKLSFFTKIELEEYKYLIHPLPDAYIALSEGRNTKRYLVEIFDSSYPRFAIRNRIERYIEYFQSKKFQEVTSHPFPSVLIISPEEATRAYIVKHIRSMKENDYLPDLIFFVSGSFDSSWEKA